MDLIAFLKEFLSNPAIYLLLVFVYAILVAIILPIPIEFAFIWPFLNQEFAFFIAVMLVIAIGKGLGALLVLYLGIKVEKTVFYWSRKFKWFGKVVHYFTLFVEKTGYVGLFIILSIPLMMDTIPIYIYSIFHPEGKAPKMVLFGLTNFLAGINRAVIIAVIISVFGVVLV